MNNWDNDNFKELVNAFNSLENEKEIRAFLRDLLTDQELTELSLRLRAANLLSKKVPYTEIIKDTGLSSTTIARISKWLQKGEGGYQLVLKRS